MKHLFLLSFLCVALAGCWATEKDETGKSPIDYGTATFFEKLQDAKSLQDLGVAFVAGVAAVFAAKKGRTVLTKAPTAPAAPPLP